MRRPSDGFSGGSTTAAATIETSRAAPSLRTRSFTSSPLVMFRTRACQSSADATTCPLTASMESAADEIVCRRSGGIDPGNCESERRRLHRDSELCRDVRALLSQAVRGFEHDMSGHQRRAHRCVALQRLRAILRS